MEKRKEKSELEELIELLNEYETPRSWVVYKSYDDYDWFFYWVDCDWETEIAWSDSLICSKKFWWIWWLVENDKIKDLEEIDYIYWPELVNHQTEIIYTPYSLYNSLLMLLSISNSPIEDLISYLK